MLGVYYIFLLFLPLSFGSILTLDQFDKIQEDHFDFIIVGGGTAGSVLATRLTEDSSNKVLVIEAGGNNDGIMNTIVPSFTFNNLNTLFDWNFTSVSQRGLNGQVLPMERGHGLGGSSSINAMAYTRGSSDDYDRFADITGDSGWSWLSLQPYIKKHESFVPPVDGRSPAGDFNPAVHGFSGPILTTLPGLLNPSIDSRVLQASQQLKGDFTFNIDMNSGKPLGVGWLQSTNGHGERSSSAVGYLTPDVRERSNLQILIGTRVTRVLKSSGNGLKLTTVEISTTSSNAAAPRVTLTASKEVILSAGGIGTPHILLHSGIGNKNDLDSLGITSVLNIPSVGMNLTDHPLYSVSFDLDIKDDSDPWGNLNTDPSLQAAALSLWNKNKTGPYVTFGRFNQLAYVRLPKTSPVFAQAPDVSSGPSSPHYELALSGSATSISAGIALVSPASRGSVTLKTNNPFDAPLIDPAFFAANVDLAIARESIRGFMRLVAAPVWKNVSVGPTAPLVNNSPDQLLDAIIRNTTGSSNHAMGTAAMSPAHAQWGVVNPDLLLKNAAGLRIVDASIMPFIPSAHIQAPVYIISERAADMIKAAWASK